MGSRERVAEYLLKSGASYELREFGESTKNSVLAAQALGCEVAEIAKSVVFLASRPAVVVVSGDRRVSVPKLSKFIGEARIATADEVRDRTGFPIGGVPPFPTGTGWLSCLTSPSRGSAPSGRQRGRRTPCSGWTRRISSAWSEGPLRRLRIVYREEVRSHRDVPARKAIEMGRGDDTRVPFRRSG